MCLHMAEVYKWELSTYISVTQGHLGIDRVDKNLLGYIEMKEVELQGTNLQRSIYVRAYFLIFLI